MNEGSPSHEHVERPWLAHLCDFFRNPSLFYVGNLESWAQRRRTFEALLPDTDRVQLDVDAHDERRFLEKLEIDRLTLYMALSTGSAVSPWGEFAVWICDRLLRRPDWADTASFPDRHHFVLAEGAAYPGWGSDARTRRALTLAQGWYGARVHGETLLLPDNYLDLDDAAQLELINRSLSS